MNARILELVDTPPVYRASGRILGISMAALLVGLVLVPWQQSVGASGQVVAYSPMDRAQVVEAPVGGRVVKWFVLEGSQVKAGDPIAEIVDIDPNYVSRLESNRDAVLDRLGASDEQAKAYQSQEGAYDQARDLQIQALGLKVRMAQQKILAAHQKLDAEQAQEETASLNLTREKQLYQDGLTSKRSVEIAELLQAKATAAVNTARASLSEAMANKTALQAEQVQKSSEALAKVASAKASYRKALAEKAYAQSELNKVDVDLARQASQNVTAPRSGTILSVLGDKNIVKSGDLLAMIIPDAAQIAVELWVDGNDAPLLEEGREVRLQFEGWPAVQFVGWPSVATGTFGGTVAFVDIASRRQGAFRILVTPKADDAPWPDSRRLRQGVRARGWVLMDQVKLGYELWRQFNGFPVGISEKPNDDKRSEKSS
jgi:membrane fusion protein, adhesin transport system